MNTTISSIIMALCFVLLWLLMGRPSWGEVVSVDVPQCKGGEVGFLGVNVHKDESLVYFLATQEMPFKGTEPIICGFVEGQMAMAVAMGKEL